MMTSTILYVTEAILAAAVLSNVGIIICYYNDKKRNDEIKKGTTETTRDIETLRQSVQNLTERMYTLKSQITEIARVADVQIEKIEKVEAVVEDTILMDSHLTEIVSEIELEKPDVVVLSTAIENPYKEKELSVKDLINIYPEYKGPESIGSDSVKYKFKQFIEGDSIEIQ